MNPAIRLLLSIALSVAPLASALPQDTSGDELRCISLRRIDRTEVIDDRHIVFRLRGGDIYLNQLSRSCPRLDLERRFSYRTSTSQLCSIDSITVIENSAFGLIDGASCGLGMFTPIAEDMLEVLKGDQEEAEVTVTDVEIEDSETADEEQ